MSEIAAQPRFTALIFGVFASAALVLAVVGVYGIVAYGVTQRTREIGVRLALGAQPWTVVRMVLREGAAMAFVGVVLGVFGALSLTRLIQAMLYDVSPTDIPTFAAAAVLVTVVALGATLLPARRATRVDPKTALVGD